MSVVIEEDVIVEQDELTPEVKRRLQELFSSKIVGPEKVGEPATCQVLMDKGTHKEICGEEYAHVCGDPSCRKFICEGHTYQVGALLTDQHASKFLCPLCYHEYLYQAYQRGKERLG